MKRLHFTQYELGAEAGEKLIEAACKSLKEEGIHCTDTHIKWEIQKMTLEDVLRAVGVLD